MYHALGYGTLMYLQAALTFDMVNIFLLICYKTKVRNFIMMVERLELNRICLWNVNSWIQRKLSSTSVLPVCYLFHSKFPVIPCSGNHYVSQFPTRYSFQADIEAAVKAVKRSVQVCNQQRKKTGVIQTLTGTNYQELTEGWSAFKFFSGIFTLFRMRHPPFLVMTSFLFNWIGQCKSVSFSINQSELISFVSGN